LLFVNSYLFAGIYDGRREKGIVTDIAEDKKSGCAGSVTPWRGVPAGGPSPSGRRAAAWRQKGR
jgi:hypothetical protein